MKKHLIYQDAKSNKFWSIETSGKSFTVTYGKVGTVGQTSTKEFDTKEKCMKEAEKLVNEKVKKGYKGSVSINKSSKQISPKKQRHDYLKEWEAIVNEKDWRKALVDHLAYLADTPGIENVLTKVVDKALKVTFTKGDLTIQFPNNETMRALPPATKISSKYPLSYQKLLSKHKLICLEDARINLGEHEFFDNAWFEALKKEGSALLESKPKDIVSPLWDYSDCWVFHPTEKNSFGEPVIYYLSHDGGDIDNAQPHNAGSLFLMRCAKSLDLNQCLKGAEKIVKKKLRKGYKEKQILYIDDYADKVALVTNGLTKVKNDLYDAIDEKPADKERLALVKRGKKKVADYEKLLLMLAGSQRLDAIETCERDINYIRKSLETLEK